MGEGEQWEEVEVGREERDGGEGAEGKEEEGRKGIDMINHPFAGLNYTPYTNSESRTVTREPSTKF